MGVTAIEGVIVNSDSEFLGRIEINTETGLIEKVGPAVGQSDVDCSGCLIFPGFIDLHVHARECMDHSWDYKEDFMTAGAAAINGGVVAFADMPNNPTPPIDDSSYEAKLELTKKSPVPIVLYAGVTPNTTPLSYAVPYKVYMGKSTGDLFFSSREQLELTMVKYNGQNISFHCEDPEILESNKNQPTHSLRRPPQAETQAIEFALELIEKYDLRARICHCSTVEGVEKIIAAKKRGLRVTVEITPHHLYFDEETISSDQQGRLQINPPIRNSKVDRLKLIQYLKNGDIDCLATDHSPHTLEEKNKGASGMPHLDTYGPFTSWLMKENDFTSQEIARACSHNPAIFLNPFLLKSFGKGLGKIEPGYAGSLTIMDIHKPLTVTADKLKTKCRWSPFEGVTFPGSVRYTVVAGKIYKNL